jgi:tRNA-modifying protein YgfZ
MLSNDIETLGPGEACDALLLTAKARVIATTTAWRRGADDFLLFTEPGLGDVLLAELRRFRFAAKLELEPEAHRSTLVLGDKAPPGAIANGDYGVPAYELLDGDPPEGAVPIDEEALELLRIEARTPRMGREIDDRVMPAEAGLEERTISFTKGCYPGQEPVARLHYRGHTNRGLRVLEIEGDALPAYDAPLTAGDAVVGRVTSAVRAVGGTVVALGYVRREVPVDAELLVDGTRRARTA